MARPLLAWFLLLNYLLVVGAGLRVGRPDQATLSAAHPYVHSKACQQQHYLRLDCFEHCNGEQAALAEKQPTGTGLHFLVQLKGLDVHCADWQPRLLPGPPPPRWAGASPWRLGRAVGAVTGFGQQPYQPPKQG